MSPKKTIAARTERKEQASIAALIIPYRLADLPSSQHRAGLAGLVLFARRLQRIGLPNGAICELIDLSPTGATLHINQAGLRALFDEVYAASWEEQESASIRKNRQKQEIAPRRTEEREQVDPVTGKIKTKKVYIYPAVVPKAALLSDFQPDSGGEAWMKLWRDMFWSILRGVPATRGVFEERAEPVPYSKDADDAWAQLLRPDKSATLSSTLFLGAMAVNAEGVSFEDAARWQFLLHFWVYVAQVYQPSMIDRDGKSQYSGFAIAIPDVYNLTDFCDDFPEAMRARDGAMQGYRPREAVIDLAAESALELLRLLGKRVGAESGAVGGLVLAIDVFHMDKQGNNIRQLGNVRVAPDDRLPEYMRVRAAYRERIFRRQRMANVLDRKPWWHGYERLLSTRPYEQTIGSKWFARDARFAFIGQGRSEEMPEPSEANQLELVFYDFIRSYVAHRLKSKFDISWEQVKELDKDHVKRKEFEKARNKIAKDAFLAVRSRTGNDFISYFAGTLGSVPQHIGKEKFALIASALRDAPDYVRTLTMLALSANS